MIYAEALRHGAAVLAAAGIEEARREARLLARFTLGLPPGAPADPAAAVEAGRFNALLARRASREPMAYIVGHQGFWTLELTVSPATLIPRADSETLIEAALAAFPDRAAVRRVLDLGTGTGALLLAVLTEYPAAWGVGVERSAAAAALAMRNAAANGLDDRAALLCGDWAAALECGADLGRFDLILANPPYIRTGAIAGLMPEVSGYEPRLALDGGADGLAAHRAIISGLSRLLAPGGAAVLEIGEHQAAATSALALAAGFGEPALRHDLGGIARALVLRLPAECK